MDENASITRATLRHADRASLELLAKWLGVARPQLLPSGLLVHEIMRRGKMQR